MSEAPDPTNSKPKRLPPLLRRAWYSLNQAFRHRIAPLGLTPDQYSILRWLNEGDTRGLTQRTLSDLMASDPNTITSTLSRMEKAKLVSREPHEADRRAHRVMILPKGRRAFQRVQAVALELQTHILGSLSEDRQEQFLEDLAVIADACAGMLELPKEKKK